MRALPLAATLLFLLSFSPLAAAQAPTGTEAEYGYAGGSVEVTLYGHLWDLLNKAPLNTQPMPSGMDLHRGFGRPSVKGAGPAEGVSSPNVLYFYSSASFVEYGFLENGVPRFHPERGISYDVQLDTGAPATFYWYLSADATEVSAVGQDPADNGSLPGKVGIIPRLTVDVTVREGDAVGGNLDEGALIARGSLMQDVVNAGDDAATEFAVPLAFEPGVAGIRASEGYNVKVEWYQLDAEGSRATQGDWNLRTGFEFPNRLVWSILNPVRILSIHPQFVGDRLVIHAEANSPWGNYDVDAANVSLEISGPSPAKSVERVATVQRTHEHNHHGEPVAMTWTWEYQKDAAAPGLYSIRLSVPNNQASAMAVRAASVTVAEGGGPGDAFTDKGERLAPAGVAEDAPAERGIPALGPVAVLAAFAAVAVRRRAG